MIIKIGNTVLPAPSSYKITYQDIDSDNTVRNQSGLMVRDRVVGGDNAKRKIECSWSGLTTAQLNTILRSILAVKFNVTYPDPLSPVSTGDITYNTMEAYCGDRSTSLYAKRSGDKYIWEGLSVSFIQY